MSKTKRETPEQRPKKWLIISAVVLLIIVIGVVILSYYAEPALKDRLEQEANEALGPDINLRIGDLSIGYVPLAVTLSNIEITPQGRGDIDAKDVQSRIDRVHVSGIGLRKLLMQDDVSIRSIEISGAELHIIPERVSELVSEGETSDAESEDTEIQFGNISLQDSDIHIYRTGQREPHTLINKLELSIDDLDLSSNLQRFSEKVGNAEIMAESVSHMLKEGNYRLVVENPRFELQSGNLWLNKFEISPQYSPQELPEKLGHEVDHFDISSGQIEIRGIQVDEWVESNEMIASAIELNDLVLEISRDKNFPDKPRTEDPLLNEQFANLDYAVSIDTLFWKGGSITYREIEEEQDQYGAVLFDSVDIEFFGIQNRNPDERIRARAFSSFMGLSDLNVDFEFSTGDMAAQYISGRLDQINLTELNPILEPLAFVRIEDGVLHSLEFNFKADNRQATGDLIAIYNDLSIKKLDDKTLEESTSNNIVSFFANLIAIRSSNEGEDARTGEIEFERESDRSMFSYWWKSLRQGLKSTAQRI